MTALKTAVIGVGMIGGLHARAYAENPRSELVAVADVDERRAAEVGAQWNVPSFVRTEDLLESVAVDAVTIATSEHDRFDPTVACAEAGVHLLLEKPLAPDLAGAERLAGALEGATGHVMVDFILRFDPRYQQAASAAHEGALGTLHSMFARRRGTSLGAEIYGPWTDLLISTGIHDLDAMAWVAGAPAERVFAEGVSSLSAEHGHQDAVMVMVRFSNDVVGVLETSWVLPPTVPALLDASLHVVGTGGGVFIDGSNQGMAVVDADGFRHPDLTHWPINEPGLAGDLAAAVDHFIRAVSADRPPAMSLAEALAAHRLVDAAEQSIRSHQPIEMTD